MSKKLIILTLTIILLVNSSTINSIMNSKTTVPSEPILNELILQNNAVELTWETPLFNGGNTILGYRIYRTSNLSTSFELIGSTASLKYSDSSFDKSSDYYYAIRAYNVDGESANSNIRGIAIVLQHNSGILGTISFYLPYVLLLFLIVIVAIVIYAYIEYRKKFLKNSSNKTGFIPFFKKQFTPTKNKSTGAISSHSVDGALEKIEEILQENQSEN